MFLTAHRVDTGQRQGINAFLYQSGRIIDQPDLELAALERDPGELAAAACDIAPGQNDVLSYLDIIANDGCQATDLTQLRASSTEVLRNEPERLPLLLKSGNQLVRFGCTIGHHQAGRHLDDYDQLWDRALAVLAERPVPSWLNGQSLIILRGQVGDQLIYELDEASFKRVKARKGPRWPQHRFTVDVFDQMDIESMHGDITESIITAITGLGLDDLKDMGGVTILHRPTGTELYRYP